MNTSGLYEVTLYTELQDVVKAKANSSFCVKLGQETKVITVSFNQKLTVREYRVYVDIENQTLLGSTSSKEEVIEIISKYLKKSGFKEKNVSIEEIPHLDHISIEEPKQEFSQLIVSGGIFNSDDLDSAREYCKENDITFKSYDGSTGTLILEGSKDKLLEAQELLEENYDMQVELK